MSGAAGILLVDKPVGPTSHDIVSRARRALGVRRIGHTGTLDPFASGLLILCVGTATRLAEYLTGMSKTYSATMLLGVVTDTDDTEGAVVATDDGWRQLGREQVEAALREQRGDILQIPPRYSAKKVAGQRMFDVARAGGEVTLEASAVTVTRLEIVRFEPPEVDLEVECSSGTYIRAIARDVGEALGCGAHLTALRRTSIGSFRIADAVEPESIDDRDSLRSGMRSPASALTGWPTLRLTAAEMATVAHGGSVPAPEGVPAEGAVALLSADGELVAVGEARDGRIQPRKVFA